MNRRFITLTLLTAALIASGSSWAREGVFSEDYYELPLSFEVNQGQSTDEVKFLSRGSGHVLFLTPEEAVLVLKKPREGDRNGSECAQNALRIHFPGSSASPAMEGMDLLSHQSNYFIGNNPTRWRTSIPNFAKVRYAGIYAGIDLIYYGNQGRLEYDFVVHPCADPEAIALQFVGAEDMALDPDGNLSLFLRGGEVVFRRPILYQIVNGRRRDIEGSYTLSDGELRFQIGDYSKEDPLIIDPMLVYSTYLGGSGIDSGVGIAVDATGIYIAGWTQSANFPTASPYQGSFQGNTDAFVAKLNPAGSALIFSTYLGGSAEDRSGGSILEQGTPLDTISIGNCIAVDASGNVHITGHT